MEGKRYLRVIFKDQELSIIEFEAQKCSCRLFVYPENNNMKSVASLDGIKAMPIDWTKLPYNIAVEADGPPQPHLPHSRSSRLKPTSIILLTRQKGEEFTHLHHDLKMARPTAFIINFREWSSIEMPSVAVENGNILNEQKNRTF